MNEVEFPHEEGEDEVHFRDDDPQTETTPPTPITSHDMEVIIKGWEVKFEHILRCLREVQLASEKANSGMFGISREGRAHEDQQERRIEAMHVGFTEFIEKCDPAHLISSRHLDAPTASTPYTPYTPSTPTGLPSRLRPDFEFQPSPVGQDEPTETARSTDSRTREHDAIRDTRSRRHSGHAHPGSRRHSGHAHPRSQQHKGHTHPRPSRRQRSGQRSTIQRTANIRRR